MVGVRLFHECLFMSALMSSIILPVLYFHLVFSAVLRGGTMVSFMNELPRLIQGNTVSLCNSHRVLYRFELDTGPNPATSKVNHGL